MRKKYPAAFKAKIALEAAKGGKSMAELAAKYEVYPNQIAQWKKALLARSAGRLWLVEKRL